MKLEVGMYVRTDSGIIGKIYEKIGDMFTYEDSNRDYITYGLTHNEILKASFNIIDLIEVGDYVNGEKVVSISLYRDDDGTSYWCTDTNVYDTENYKIKSILTHEQFSQNAYTIEKER